MHIIIVDISGLFPDIPCTVQNVSDLKWPNSICNTNHRQSCACPLKWKTASVTSEQRNMFSMSFMLYILITEEAGSVGSIFLLFQRDLYFSICMFVPWFMFVSNSFFMVYYTNHSIVCLNVRMYNSRWVCFIVHTNSKVCMIFLYFIVTLY